MNYVMTLSELQTLAGMCRIRSMLLPAGCRRIDRAGAVQAVFQLTEREILVPDGTGFRCLPEVRELLRPIQEAERCLLVTDPIQKRPQRLCYFGAGFFTVLSSIPERREEYRICGCRPADLPAFLLEDGVLPEPEERTNAAPEPVPEILAGMKPEDYFELPGLAVALELLDPVTGDILQRAGIFATTAGLRLAREAKPAVPLENSAVDALYTEWFGRKPDDSCGYLCSFDGTDL